jgi:tetratricopeptide (TPR) repeat protein
MKCSSKALFLLVSLTLASFAQRPETPQTTETPDNKAGAYYNFAMGRVYNELAQAEGNREYVNKAIQYYQEALKLDPSASVIFDELTDLYVQTGRLADAVSQAEDLLKRDPDNLDARRMLARIFTQMARGTGPDSKVDDDYLHKATAEFQKVVAKDPKDAESWVMLGNLYRAASDPPNAEKAFDSALAAEPDNEEALKGLAVMYSEMGDSAKAMEKWKALADKNPNPHTLASLAQQYEQMNDYKSAAEVLRKAVAANPDEESLAQSLAYDLAEAGQYDEAIQTYAQLAADNPRTVPYPLELSRLYLVQYGAAKAKHDTAKADAALAQAEEWLKKAQALDATSLQVRDQAANVLDAQGKTADAIAELKTALDEVPRRHSANDATHRAIALRHLALLYRSDKQYREAIDTFRQLTAMDDERFAPEAWMQIVDTCRESKDVPCALRESAAALKKYPNNPMAIEEHATVLADTGKVDEAASEMRGLLKGDAGDDCKIQIAVAEVYEKGKRWNDMAKALNEAERLAHEDHEKEQLDLEQIDFMRGAMWERQKKYDASEAAFRKALELNPKDAQALNYLGYMFADRGVRLDEAYDLIKKAVDLDPENGAFLDSLGWVYFRQGKLNEAEGLLQRALDKMQDPTVHDHLGDVYLKLGKTKEAIAQWQASLREFQKATEADNDPEEVAKVNKKLDEAQARLAKEVHQ